MEHLRALDPSLSMHYVSDCPFSIYGCVLTGYDFSVRITYLCHQTGVPS